MPAEREIELCSYDYDPLDRLVSCTRPKHADLQRFYCKSKLATEIQDSIKWTVFQYNNQLLAQQKCQDSAVETSLLGTDQQHSILHFSDGEETQRLVYTAYGHRSAVSGLNNLLGFNGERPDPITGHYLLGNGYRAFNPVLMRFNSPDSLSPFGKGGLNPYAYCFGDPINLADPNGHTPWGAAIRLFRRIGLMAPKTSRSAATAAQAPHSMKGSYNSVSKSLEGSSKQPPIPGATERSYSDVASGSELSDAVLSGYVPFDGLKGSTLQSLSKNNSEYMASIQRWDRNRGFRNLVNYIDEARSYNGATYDIISKGVDGKLKGVLPHRAYQYSKIVATQDSHRFVEGGLAQQREIFRHQNNNAPLPETLQIRRKR